MDDLISRQAVLENAFAIYTHECGLVEVVGVATIKDLPSVKPQEPKTGHWIYIGNGHNGLNKCSECGGERKMFDEGQNNRNNYSVYINCYTNICPLQHFPSVWS